jgi:hypothetical protein
VRSSSGYAHRLNVFARHARGTHRDPSGLEGAGVVYAREPAVYIFLARSLEKELSPIAGYEEKRVIMLVMSAVT